MAQNHKHEAHEETHNSTPRLEEAAHTVTKLRPEMQGYLLIGAGILLIFLALGFFKWSMIIGGSLLIGWGIIRSDFIGTIAYYLEKIRSRF